MQFYESIAHHYDDIFPLSDTLKRFLDTFPLDPGADSVLDVGCSTGTIPLYLAARARLVIGMDLDPTMISIAESRLTAESDGTVAFTVGDMTLIDEAFRHERFSLVLCLGNTLVHLRSPAMIAGFLARVARLLAPGGRFVFQILNYERILNRHVDELPLIDNDKVRFERHYRYRPNSPLLDFETRLTVKASGETIENSLPLYPLKKDELERLLPSTGLSAVKYLGDYGGNTYTPESDLLVSVLAQIKLR
jgi:glycine/sarcosine N-methyltransferase